MDAAENFARKVAATWAAQPQRMGREWRTFCPVHEGDGGMHKPSLAIWPSGDRFHFKCMTGCSNASVAEALRERGVSTGFHGPVTQESKFIAAQRREQHRVTQMMKAQEILSEAEQLSAGCVNASGLYLVKRGIELGPTTLPTLCEATDPMWPSAFVFAGVICDMTTLRETPRCVGMSMLSLHGDGSPRIGETSGKKFRSIIGASKGFAVPYGTPGPHLLIAEGIETMLAGMQLEGVPFGAATLAAPNMPAVVIPEYVRQVTICADNDTPGMEAAATLATELGQIGLRVGVQRWGKPHSGFDAADELMRRKGMTKTELYREFPDAWPGATNNAEGGR